MHKKIIYLLFVFLTLGTPLISEAKLVFEQEQINVKASLTDKKTEVVYSFKNEGKKAIEILRIKPSCGCTVANLEKRSYKPGESGAIKTVFKHERGRGVVRNTIGILTDEPSDALYKLVLSVEIPELAKIKPRFLLWRKGENPGSKTIMVEAAGDKKIQNVTLTQDNPVFQLETETLEEGKSYALKITPPEGDSTVQSRATIEVVLESGITRSYRVYIRVQ